MASIITLAGERLFAAKAQANEQLDIDTFIFANVPNQDPTAPINREEALPAEHEVHRQAVQQVGRINDNVVVYSTVLDSVTGSFDFNWVGLYSSANQTLVAINHVPTVTKTVTAPGVAGNTLNRNFGIEYSGVADLTGIDVKPETWQLDFTARLSGMDELTRQLAKDLNGKDWFIDDGFKVEPRSTVNTFRVVPGVGYVSGLRVELENEHILTVQTYPQFVYVDAWFDGAANSMWKPQTAFTVTNGEMDDYVDPQGRQHYVYKLAVINAADDVEDLRSDRGLAGKDWVQTQAKIKSMNALVGRTLSEYFSDVINICDKGAKKGGVFDCTSAIDSALDEWVSGDRDTIYIPDGTYLYNGNKHVDLLGAYGKNIRCDGALKLGQKEGVSISITNGAYLNLQFKIKKGGVLGDFTNSNAVGGSTFLQLSNVYDCLVDIRANSYEGRVFHSTAVGDERCINMKVKIRTSGRPANNSKRCGQAFFCDSGTAKIIGAFGEMDWRGEGSVYGPVFERLNDVRIPSIEGGEFLITPIEFRGVNVCIIDSLYIGETDVGDDHTDGVRFIPNSGGLQCGEIHIKTLRLLRNVNGLYAENFKQNHPSLIIDSCMGNNISGSVIKVHNVPNVSINSLSGSVIGSLFEASGDKTESIDVKILSALGIQKDGILIDCDVVQAIFRGVIKGGAKGYSLINIIGNRDVTIDNMSLATDVCDQMININYPGDNFIHHIDGEVRGSSPIYTQGRRPALIENVSGNQVKYRSSSSFTANEKEVSVDNVTSIKNANVLITPKSNQLSGIYVSKINESTITFQVPEAVTSKAEFDYLIDGSIIHQGHI